MSRVSTGSYSGPWQSADVNERTGVRTVTNNGSANLFSRTVTRSDIVKSSNRKLIPLRPLPYSCTVSEIQYISGYLRFRLTSQTYREYVGALVGLVATNSLPPAVTIQPATRRAAELKLREKIKNQDVNLAQAFGEAGKTAALVVQTAKTIAGAAIDLKHGNFMSAARKLGVHPRKRKSRKRKPTDKELHQDWLELQYGWKPLLSDVYGAAKTFADNNTENPDRLWVKIVADAKRNNYSSESHGSGATSYSLREDRDELVRLICYIKQSNPAIAAASSLGFTNPAYLAWELMPWSFVVDWFLPVGDYLSSLDATLGWDFLCGCRSEIAIAKRYNPKWTGTHSTYMAGQLKGGSRHYAFNRVVLSDFPSTSLPRLKNPLSMLHVANAMALLKGAFNRK